MSDFFLRNCLRPRIKEDLILWTQSYPLNPSVNDVHNNHHQRHKLFWDLEQHKDLNAPPWCFQIVQFSRVDIILSPHLKLSYCCKTNYVCVWHSKCQGLVWLMVFFWQRGGWDRLVSPCDLQTQWTQWMSSCFLSVCYSVACILSGSRTDIDNHFFFFFTYCCDVLAHANDLQELSLHILLLLRIK